MRQQDMTMVLEEDDRDACFFAFASSAFELIEVLGREDDFGSARTILVGASEVVIALGAFPQDVGESVSCLSR